MRHVQWMGFEGFAKLKSYVHLCIVLVGVLMKRRAQERGWPTAKTTIAHTVYPLILTRQVENEYASLVRGDEGETTGDGNTLPILQPIECNNPGELAKLRAAGKWFRYLGAKGCYLWIHSLTREITPLRPADYVEEEALNEAEEEEDVAGERYPESMATAVVRESRFYGRQRMDYLCCPSII